MDCRTCQPTLLDLAYGELAPELAATAHKHLSQCPRCSASYSQLTRAIGQTKSLELLEPPAEIQSTLTLLAHQRANERRKATEAEAARSSGPIQSVLDFVARLANARQVAMATIMLLIVAVGLWSLPALQRDPSAAGVTVVNPDARGEAAPSPGLKPAEPLDLTVDARSRRIRTREEEQRLAATRPEPEAPAVTEPGVAAATGSAQPSRASAERKQDDLGLDDLDSVFAPAPSKSAPASASAAVSASNMAREAPVRRDRNAAAAADVSSDDALTGLMEGEGRIASAKGAADLRPASKAKSEVGLRAESERGSGVATTGPTPEPYAQQPAAPQPGSPPAAMSLASARAIRAQRGCSAALSAYAQVASTADANDRAHALLEQAECSLSLGRALEARALLERAAKLPATQMRAKALLASLEDQGAATAPAAAEPPAARE